MAKQRILVSFKVIIFKGFLRNLNEPITGSFQRAPDMMTIDRLKTLDLRNAGSRDSSNVNKVNRLVCEVPRKCLQQK